MITAASMLLGPMLGGALGSIGSTLGNIASAIAPFASSGLDFLGGLLTNQSNADEAARNRRFVAKMYKKRYQNTVEDMRKAGLNPVLAANGGSVGTAPSGSMATFTNPVHGAVGTALQTMTSLQGLENAKSQQALTESQTGLNQSKKVAQDISNKYLDPQARALAEKAQFDASIANSASEIQRARAQFADELAENERVRSYNDAVGSKYRNLNDFWDYQHNKKDFAARPSTSEERNWWRAKKILDSVGSGVNSAVGAGKFMRYMRYFR